MAKKIALLLSLVMMLSFSCVFATELSGDETTANTEVVEVVSGDEAVSGEEVVSGDEVVSGEVADTEIASGEVETPVSGEEETKAPANTETPATSEAEEGNGSVLAAVIAIVVVVAIVAIVSVLKKK